MASPLVVAAVEARLAANWTDTPIVLPNTASLVPIDGSAFLTLEFPVADEEQISIGAVGSRIFRETGAFTITLAIPVGVGLNPNATPYLTWLDALRTVFRGQAFASVNTLAPSSIAEFGENEDGSYFELAFSTPYYFDNATG